MLQNLKQRTDVVGELIRLLFTDVKHMLLKLIAGKSPVVMNVKIDGTLVAERHSGGFIYNNIFTGSNHPLKLVDPLEIITEREGI